MEKRKIEGEMIGVDGYFVHSLNKKQNNFEERQRRHTSSTKSNENFKLELFSMENYMWQSFKFVVPYGDQKEGGIAIVLEEWMC